MAVVNTPPLAKPKTTGENTGNDFLAIVWVQ